MTTDITEKLESARTDAGWSKGVCRQLLTELASTLEGSTVDWDHEAGEDWGRILLGEEVVALLWIPGAFAFLSATYSDVHLRILRSYSMPLEIVKDWEKDNYRVDRESLLQLSGRNQLPGTFDPSRFSANDLWFATV